MQFLDCKNKFYSNGFSLSMDKPWHSGWWVYVSKTDALVFCNLITFRTFLGSLSRLSSGWATRYCTANQTKNGSKEIDICNSLCSVETVNPTEYHFILQWEAKDAVWPAIPAVKNVQNLRTKWRKKMKIVRYLSGKKFIIMHFKIAVTLLTSIILLQTE